MPIFIKFKEEEGLSSYFWGYARRFNNTQIVSYLFVLKLQLVLCKERKGLLLQNDDHFEHEK
jgi:hypothetical protein